MFGNIGLTELLIIMGVALVILGPEKFPGYTRMALRTYRDLRKYLTDVKQDIAQELNPVKDELNRFSRYDAETYLERIMEEESKPEPEPEPETPTVPEPTSPEQGPAVIFTSAPDETEPPPPESEQGPRVD